VLASVAAVGVGAPSGRPRGVWRSGLAAGLAGAAAALGLGLLDGRSPAEAALVAAGALAGGLVLVPPLAGLALGLAGRLLGHVTSHRLRQLANLNHPALKELIVQAPGTYHHSILMGTMVEAAAGAIGADALLARVGAYYHDVGKIRNPLLFAENQRGDNEHDELPPQRSAQAVKRHVTEGLELARRWRLPRSVVDLMQQHHGTRRIDYFWAKHQKAVEAGEASPIDESEFRYPGPRPRSREAALVMLADVCEASARGLTRPDAVALQALVDQRLAELVEEGQLEECDLTHREVAVVAEALAAALAEVYGRPERPAPPGTPPPRPHVQLVTGP
jgi:cyclic-di-AMP phosphodiesterase PgpH